MELRQRGIGCLQQGGQQGRLVHLVLVEIVGRGLTPHVAQGPVEARETSLERRREQTAQEAPGIEALVHP